MMIWGKLQVAERRAEFRLSCGADAAKHLGRVARLMVTAGELL